MSKIQNLNTDLEKLNMRLSHIEVHFNDVDLNRVQQLKPRVIDRVSNTLYIGHHTQKSEARKKDEKAIDKFFSNLMPSNLLRLKSQSFGNRLIFGSFHISARLNRRKFDTNQSIEKFF